MAATASSHAPRVLAVNGSHVLDLALFMPVTEDLQNTFRKPPQRSVLLGVAGRCGRVLGNRLCIPKFHSLTDS